MVKEKRANICCNRRFEMCQYLLEGNRLHIDEVIKKYKISEKTFREHDIPLLKIHLHPHIVGEKELKYNRKYKYYVLVLLKDEEYINY